MKDMHKFNDRLPRRHKCHNAGVFVYETNLDHVQEPETGTETGVERETELEMELQDGAFAECNHVDYDYNQHELQKRQRIEPVNLWRAKIDQCEKMRRMAGGIILNRELTHIVLVKSRNSNKWGIPKGGVEDEETDIEGALREMYEECGILIETPELVPMAPCITFRGVRIFLFCWNDEMENCKLGPVDTYEISECGWFDINTLFSDLNSHQKTSCNGNNNNNKLPVISADFLEDVDMINFDTLDDYLVQQEEPLLLTILFRDLLRERLEPIRRKIITNMANYQVNNGKLVLNDYLVKFLDHLHQSNVNDLSQLINNIQHRFPMVFYVPELVEVLGG